jgi:hypothetical protein
MVEFIRDLTRVGVDATQPEATVDKNPPGVDVPAPCLPTTWPIKAVVLVADMVHFLQQGDIANVSTPTHSNIRKQNNNWNVRYSCGFGIEDGYTLMTCPMGWRKHTHNVTFTRNNAQIFLAGGSKACTKGMHKTMLPMGTRWHF